MPHKMTLKEICHEVESSYFDRKSARIDARALAVLLIAFANADGGTVAIGVEDDGTITGIDNYKENINKLLNVPFDFCKPSISNFTTEEIKCKNNKGVTDHILLIHIAPSTLLHTNQTDEAFFRIGDRSKKLNFEERLQLMYSKGTRYFEDSPVPDADLEDLDLSFVKKYIAKIGYKRKSAQKYLEENKDFVITKNGKREISAAAILLFGKNPSRFFPRARVRVVKYEGTEAKVGAAMNVIKDVSFTGRILEVVEKSLDFMRSQIKEYTYLGPDTKFVTEPEYPEFAWQEIIINAIAHRDYSIKGTDIQVKIFDDKIVVESPGTLPGIVRLNNMRSVHFSRNPKLAQFLHEYEYVKEFGEGVDRLYEVMKDAGLPKPEYKVDSFMLYATIRNKRIGDRIGDRIGEKIGDRVGEKVGENTDGNGYNSGTIIASITENQEKILAIMRHKPTVSAYEIGEKIGLSLRNVEMNIRKLKAAGLLARKGAARGGYWVVL